MPKHIRKPHYLFVLDDPNATDADYEDGTGDGMYHVYGLSGEVVKIVPGLDEAESLVSSLSAPIKRTAL